MPEKISKAEYLRQWRAKNPEKYKAHNDRSVALKRRLGVRRKGLGTPHFENSLGPPEEPAERHVVLSRLLRRLLLEAWDKGYLSTDKTHDDSGYETRVKAALAVSRCLSVSLENNGNYNTGVKDPE